MWRPRKGRAVPYVLAVLVLVGFGLVAVALTGEGRGGATPVDRGLLLASGLAVAYVLHRYASVRVEADDSGVTVVNLLRRRHVAWAEVVAVRMAPGAAWVQLDLADGTTLPAMGIQATDGVHGERAARALAAQVAAHP